jgi:hypothetical protein
VSENDQKLIHGDSVRLSKNNQLIAIGKFDSEQHKIHPEVVIGPS